MRGVVMEPCSEGSSPRSVYSMSGATECRFRRFPTYWFSRCAKRVHAKTQNKATQRARRRPKIRETESSTLMLKPVKFERSHQTS